MSGPRTLLLSNRNYEKDVWRCGQVEFENVVCAVDDVDVAAPRAVQRTPGRALRQVERVTKRAFGLELSYVPRIETIRLRRDYELLCVYVQGLSDLTVLDALPDWRNRCAKAVCFVEEIWVRGLPRWSRRTFEQLAKFDLIACLQHGSVSPLAALVGRRCEWLPPGVDALRFFPGLVPPPRTIDVYAMGRHSERTHRALLEHATLRDWTYLFDTLEVRRVRGGDHMQHRTQLAELVKRSRYFLANRGRVDRWGDTGQQEELGFRSFEGAAGGAVLIGDAPRGEHVRTLFDWPDAHIHVPFDSTIMPEVIAALDAEPERVARIRQNNVVQSLRRHDWVYRFRSALEWLKLAPTERLRQRTQRLGELATFSERAAPWIRAGLPVARALDAD
ncbi:MAG TPA: glycosyltransferase [Polyangiales bacterium]|nr:glycosyltransferase [Polyangiales bacterium]